MPQVEFGWFMLGGAVPGNPGKLLLMEEEPAVLPAVDEYFDSIWVNDHFYAFDDPAHAWDECWTGMTWLAARLPRLKVGSIVMGVGYRNPALLAKMAATLQVLSGGRVIMGIGAGWRGEEYAAYSYPFPSAPERIEQLDEAVQIMRRMWTEPAPSFQGKHFQIEKAYCEPRPNPPPPIMIGGGGPKRVLPLVGRQADIWDRWNSTLESIDLEDYRQKLAIVQQHAREAGRDRGAIVQSVTVENEQMPQSAEDVGRWRTHLRPLIDLGVRQFILGFGQVTNPDEVRRFAEEVIAPLRETSGAR